LNQVLVYANGNILILSENVNVEENDAVFQRPVKK